MYQRILAPIDVSVPEIGEQILQRALFYLQNSQCQLTLLAVAPAKADENALDEVRTQLMAFAETHIAANEGRIELEVSQGLPSDQVLALAKKQQADAILIGSHRGGGGQLGRQTLGSTAAKIASQSSCDVLIVKIT